jgi:cyclophilin family peptidyl-prolyl cis-trans isomerase
MTHGYPGVVGMVKKGKRKHSNECQFYITLTSLKAFDNLFVAFGRVVQGFNSIKEIENAETNLQRPNMKIVIDKCGEYQI